MNLNKKTIPRFRSLPLALTVAVSCMALSACDYLIRPEKVDPKLGLDKQDYEELNSRRIADAARIRDESARADKNIPPIPGLSTGISSPPPPKIGEDVIVSLAVTDDVPLRDVLVELTRLAGIDLEMGQGIKGGVIFKAQNRPLSEVIERICMLAGLRYSLSKGILKVEADTPLVKNYTIDFLNIERNASGGISVNTNVLSGAGGDSGSLNTGSNESIDTKVESDLWKALENTIQAILTDNPVQTSKEKQKLKQAEVVDKVQMPTAVSPAALQGMPANAQTGQVVSEAPFNSVNGSPAPVASPAPPSIKPMQAELSPAAGGDETPDAKSEKSDAFFVINRQAGILTVKATTVQHKKIADYLEKLRISASSQVLIEAKIVEVTLGKQFQSGINWQAVFNGSTNIGLNFSDFDPATTGNQIAFTLKPDLGLNLETAVKLTEQFGTSRTLSSPRLTAMNNQQAVLTFAKNQVYFEIKVVREQNTSNSNNQSLLTVDSTAKTVPIGIILNLQPSIDVVNNEVTLSVRPTLSRITEFVDDPSVAFLASQSKDVTVPPNKIPIVEVREMDSMLKLQSGQIMVMGGLMEDKSNNTDKGVPDLSDLPGIGGLFKSKNYSNSMVELVIFIKATIVSPRIGNVHDADRGIYKRFTNDPRPLKL